MVPARGVAPRFSPCHGDVLLLNYAGECLGFPTGDDPVPPEPQSGVQAATQREPNLPPAHSQSFWPKADGRGLKAGKLVRPDGIAPSSRGYRPRILLLDDRRMEWTAGFAPAISALATRRLAVSTTSTND